MSWMRCLWLGTTGLSAADFWRSMVYYVILKAHLGFVVDRLNKYILIMDNCRQISTLHSVYKTTVL